MAEHPGFCLEDLRRNCKHNTSFYSVEGESVCSAARFYLGGDTKKPRKEQLKQQRQENDSCVQEESGAAPPVTTEEEPKKGKNALFMEYLQALVRE